MATSENYVRSRIDTKTKERAAAALDAMGLSISDAIRLLMVRIAKERRLPFDIKVPSAVGRKVRAAPTVKVVERVDRPDPRAGQALASNVARTGEKPSAALEKSRGAVREAARRFHVENPRIFGSVLHGTDHDGSDLDLLVDALPGATLFDLGALQVELEELLGVPVDLKTPHDLPSRIRDRVLAEASPV